MLECRVLRRILGPKGDEVRDEWRNLHNQELDDLYNLPNMVRVRGVYRLLVGKPKGKKPLGYPSADGMIILR